MLLKVFRLTTCWRSVHLHRPILFYMSDRSGQVKSIYTEFAQAQHCLNLYLYFFFELLNNGNILKALCSTAGRFRTTSNLKHEALNSTYFGLVTLITETHQNNIFCAIQSNLKWFKNVQLILTLCCLLCMYVMNACFVFHFEHVNKSVQQIIDDL